MTIREEQIRDLLLADAEMQLLLPGGIFTDEEVGIEGIRRGAPLFANTFTPAGQLKSCALVREGDLISYPNIRDEREKAVGVTQMVQVYYIEMRGADDIQPAKDRGYAVLAGVRLTNPGSYPLIWEQETSRFYDAGPVANSTVLRQDWRVVSIRIP